MKKIVSLFTFIPFINRYINRKYYATGFGTYLLNSISKQIFRVNRGDFLTHFTSRVNLPKNINLVGKDMSSVYLSLATSGGCYYQALNGIEFSEGVLWANNCSFISANHSFEDLSKHTKSSPIVVNKNVWIGSNCVILPGVVIGENSIIGASSLVNKDVSSYSIYAGNPAKIRAKLCKTCLRKLKLTEECNVCDKEN